MFTGVGTVARLAKRQSEIMGKTPSVKTAMPACASIKGDEQSGDVF
jgi:hypothetical protein